MRRRIIALLCVLFSLAGCGGEGPPSVSAAVSDSAGVRILQYAEYPAPQVHSGTQSASYEIQIGARMGEGSRSFDGVAQVLFMPGEKIVVADRGSREIRVFDHGGTHLDTWGRRGEGPDEFQVLQTALLGPDDNIIGVDSRGPRIVRFSRGGFVGSRAVEPARSTVRIPVFLGEFDDGTLLASAVVPGHMTERPSRPEILLVRYSPWGERLSEIGIFLGSERVSIRRGPAVSTHVLPLGRNTYFASSGDLVAVVDNYKCQVVFLSQSGDPVSIVRWPPPPQTRAREARWTSFVDSAVAAVPKERAPEVRSTLESLPRSEGVPFLSAILSVGHGSVWVREDGLDLPESSWLVVNPLDGVRGRVTLPSRFSPMDVRADKVIGVWRDSMDVEFVRAYHLGPSSGTP